MFSWIGLLDVLNDHLRSVRQRAVDTAKGQPRSPLFEERSRARRKVGLDPAASHAASAVLVSQQL